MNVPKSTLGRALAEAADNADELAKFRNDFVFGEEHVIYLDGNSLGRLTRKGQERLNRCIGEEWGTSLVRGWVKGWLLEPRRAADKISRLIGAKESEVLVCDSTSVNLYKLAMAAMRVKGRKTIFSLSGNFPSDLYVLDGVGELRTFETVAELLHELNTDVGVVSLSHTCFKTGQVLDMRLINEEAQKVGAFVIWDLSHSVGVMPLHLNKYNADMAVGCTYKYLNGGPGAPAFLYVREELLPHMRNPIRGWFGHDDPFGFHPEFKPAESIEKFMTGTPPVLSMAALEHALDVILEAGVDRIRKKSFLLTEYVIALVNERLTKYGVTVASPLESRKRGSQVSLAHPEAWQLTQALIAHGVIPDFREPDILRIGLAPIYTSFVEVYDAITMLENILANNSHAKYVSARTGIS